MCPVFFGLPVIWSVLLYNFKDVEDWERVTRCKLVKLTLPVAFWVVPMRLMEALGAGVRRGRTVQVVRDYGSMEFVTQSVAFDTFTSFRELF